MVHVIQALQRWEKKDQNFEAILSYELNLRLAYATGDSVSKTTTTRRKIFALIGKLIPSCGVWCWLTAPPPPPPAHPCPALTRVYLRINIREDREAVFSNTLLKVYLMRQMGSSSALGGPDPLPPTAHPPDPSCSPILLPHRPPTLGCLSPLPLTTFPMRLAMWCRSSENSWAMSRKSWMDGGRERQASLRPRALYTVCRTDSQGR